MRTHTKIEVYDLGKPFNDTTCIRYTRARFDDDVPDCDDNTPAKIFYQRESDEIHTDNMDAFIADKCDNHGYLVTNVHYLPDLDSDTITKYVDLERTR